MKADHKVPEVLARDHAVGVLADQDKVWLERPAKTDQGGNVGLRLQSNCTDSICSVYRFTHTHTYIYIIYINKVFPYSQLSKI